MTDQNNGLRKLDKQQKRHYLALRRQFSKPIISISGYLGKSSLSEMLYGILQNYGKVLKTPHGKGSWQNTLKTMEKLSDGYDYALFEFDSERNRDFAGLFRLLKPNVGVVTNIGDAHLSYLNSAMQLALKRSEVIKYIARGGAAVLNQDDDLSSSLDQVVKNLRPIKYGLNHIADFNASDIEHLGPKGMRFLYNNKKKITLPVYSIANIYTFLACMAVCNYLQIDEEEVLKSMQKKVTLPKGRGNLEKIGNCYLLDESYIGTSRSVSKAARSLVGFKPYSKKLILIVGDMTKSGVKVEDRHLNMGYFLSALPIDHLITMGHYADYIGKGASLIKSSGKKIHSVANVNELLDILREIIVPDSAVCVKGLGNVVYHRVKTQMVNTFKNGE